MITTERFEKVNIDKLVPYARNARTHSKEQILQLRASLREFGFVNSIAKQEEPIPQVIKERCGFHDCELIELKVDKNIVMEFDTKGGFTDFNMITFTEAEIIKREDPILGGIWIYDELYSTESGYEAHILLWTSDELKDFIIRCNDIIIENNKIFN